MNIINLTQHCATEDQANEGVFEPTDKRKVQELLTFQTIPEPLEILERAKGLATIAKESGADAALVGGAPYLMGALEKALTEKGIKPLYSFSVRVSQEVIQPDGTVRKVSVFKHSGWITSPEWKLWGPDDLES